MLGYGAQLQREITNVMQNALMHSGAGQDFEYYFTVAGTALHMYTANRSDISPKRARHRRTAFGVVAHCRAISSFETPSAASNNP